jgi:UDP-N-acetylmuramate dehydrogenase
MDNDFINTLQTKNFGTVLLNEPLAKHTSFHIGGPADVMIIPDSKEHLGQLLKLLLVKKPPLTIIGNGTNILVRDKGIRGIVIKLGTALKDINIQGNICTFGSGLSLAAAAHAALEAGLTGMEFAAGIPGSVGGATYMNAGAYGGEMKDIISKVHLIYENGKEYTFSNAQMDFAYRHSFIQGKRYLVTAIEVTLKPGKKEEILAKMEDLAQRRISKQPLEMPSAGSTFKRPKGYFVGPLIEKAGLKGFTVGGAQISTKHAGFVINAGNATCADVLSLIAQVQEKIYSLYGVSLEPEILIIGEK